MIFRITLILPLILAGCATNHKIVNNGGDFPPRPIAKQAPAQLELITATPKVPD